MAVELSRDARQQVLQYVLREVHPDRLDAEIVAVAPCAEGTRVGVKASPRGYLSSAAYALVTLDDDGRVVEGEACTGRELERVLEG